MLIIWYNLLLLSISVVKYVYIFITKSPTGLNDGFWHFFINVNIIFLAFLSQAVFLILPGKFPFTYYVCSGNDPRQIQDSKINMLLVFSLLGNILTYIFVFVKSKIYRSKDLATATIAQMNNSLPVLLGNILDTSLADFTTLAGGILFVIIFQSFIGILSSVDPGKLGIYPYKIIYHSFQHLIPFMMHSLILLYYFKRHKKMRKAVWVRIINIFFKRI
jgi:hypothetical protein